MGANYGDEGKGRATRYIIKNSKLDKDKCIVIKHNGGPQAGHTSEGFVHHTYGSGKCDTYLAPTFIYNPIAHLNESVKYTAHFGRIPYNLYISMNCRVTTPVDILMNHIIEAVRSGSKHGSCGMGIYATITRNKTIPITVGRLVNSNQEERRAITRDLMLHYSGYEHAIRFIPEKYTNISIEKLMDYFYEQFDKAISDYGVHVIDECDEEKLLNSKILRVFETGQGLLLDKDCKESFPHVTPSHTDATYPLQIIKRARLTGLEDLTTPIFCTRTYLTKHGAGPCNLSPLDEKLVDKFRKMDKTNVPNEWQDSIRFFNLDICAFFDRCNRAHQKVQENLGPRCLVSAKPSYFVTWSDATDGRIYSNDGKTYSVFEYFGQANTINYDELIYGVDKGVL